MQKKYAVIATKGIIRKKEREFEVTDEAMGFQAVYKLSKKTVKNLQKMENRYLILEETVSGVYDLEFIYNADDEEFYCLFPISVIGETCYEVRSQHEGIELRRKKLMNFLFHEFIKNGTLTP